LKRGTATGFCGGRDAANLTAVHKTALTTNELASSVGGAEVETLLCVI